jgi:hypothetical protein
MPTATYTALATVTLGSSASSVTFSSIPATYRDLVLLFGGKSTSASLVEMLARINGDSGSNYSRVSMFGGEGFLGSSSSTQTAILPHNFNSTDGDFILQCMDYSATDKHKTFLARDGIATVVTAAVATRWANTAAITSIELTAPTVSFAANSVFSLYGISA